LGNFNTYRGIELHSVLSDHGSDALVGTIAAIVARIHLAFVLTPDVLHSDDTVRYIQLVVATRRRVYNDHNWHAIVILI